MGFFNGLYQLHLTGDKRDEERKVEVHAKEIEWYQGLISDQKEIRKRMAELDRRLEFQSDG